MKYMTLILVFSLFSCGTAKKQATVENEILAFFSKGACLGKCPVYDITVRSDGSYRYVGVDKINPRGERKGKLSKNQLETLNSLLKKDLTTANVFKKVRDKPVTVLKYLGETYRFYSFKTTVEKAALNNWFNDFVESIE